MNRNVKKIAALGALLAAAAVPLVKSLFVSIPDPEQAPAGTILVNYCRAPKGVEGDRGFYELVLRKTGAESLRLEVYSGEEENGVFYKAPLQAAEDCFEIIEKAKMESWNKRKDTVSLDGTTVVCKFWNGESMVRASTDAMPPNGEKALDEIRRVMTGYIREENREEA